VGAGSLTGQTLPAAHVVATATGAVAITTSHVNPFPQSAAVWHPAARAAGAPAKRATRAPTEKRTFLSDM
jgi:hypothetical protein